MTAAAVTADAQRVLVAYASKHGSTRVAEVIATTIRSLGVDVDERAAEEVEDVEPYDTVVLGTAIYMGRMRTPEDLLGAHRDELPAAGWRRSGTADTRRRRCDTRSQLEKGLAKASSKRT